MKNKDSWTHVTGKSIYIDDMITRSDTLHGIVFTSSVAKGKIISIDILKLKKRKVLFEFLLIKIFLVKIK